MSFRTRIFEIFFNLLLTTSVFCLCAVLVIPLSSFSVRYLLCLLFTGLSVLFWMVLFFSDTTPWILVWVKQKKSTYGSLALFFFFLLAGISLVFIQPQNGIKVTSIPGNKKIILDEPTFRIQPTQVPVSFLREDSSAYLISVSFYIPEPIQALLLYTSHGNVNWTLDGEKIAENDHNNANRFFLYNKKPLLKGYHYLQGSLSNASPFPAISVLTGNEKPIAGPFFTQRMIPSQRLTRILPLLNTILYLIAVFLFIPTLNAILVPISGYCQRNAFVMMGVVSILSIAFFCLVRFYFSANLSTSFEADEAAFGLMAQRLLEGQSPPLFHYGQNYQGTLEAFPLSVILSLFDSPIMGLHILPLLWGIGFILITLYTFWQYGNKPLFQFALVFLAVGGVHFHWILSKTWFGYSFSLLGGAILLLLSLKMCVDKRISPGIALSWGGIAALAFYQLPLVLPFILCSLMLVFYAIISSFSRSKNSFYVLALSILLLITPYFLHLVLEGNIGSLSFFFQGRNFPQNNVHNISMVFERIFNECLPVLFGNHPPFDNLNATTSALFPMFPSTFFMVSIFLTPVMLTYFCYSNAKKKMLSPLLLFLAYGLTFLVFLILGLSPFGIWPWYAIPLYWAIPVILYHFFYFLFSLSPSLSVASAVLFLISLISPFYDYDEYFHQAASISQSRLFLPKDFREIQRILEKENVRYLICDQGFDQTFGNPGKDWIGECLTYFTHSKIIAASRNSRRIPDASWEIMKGSRVGYLFHKDFIYNSAVTSPESVRQSLLSEDVFRTLFDDNNLNYNRLLVNPYVLYLPKKYSMGEHKSEWKLDATNPIYLQALADHNISLRAEGRDAYWSSDVIPSNGCSLKVIFNQPRDIEKIILFHGLKEYDKPGENTVRLLLPNGTSIDVGSLQYSQPMRSSYLILEKKFLCTGVEIKVFPKKDLSWWTIYELWIE